MDVTITVDGVLRTLTVDDDLLDTTQDRGPQQDAAEWSLLAAFGSAYHEAVARAAVTQPQPEPEPVAEPVAETVAPTYEPAVEPAIEGPVAPAEATQAATEVVALRVEQDEATPVRDPDEVCACGHKSYRHPEALPCQASWLIDEHDPDGPMSRCGCAQFAARG